MAKVTIENRTEHDISFSVRNEAGLLESATIPASRENPDNRKELMFGLGTCCKEGLEDAVTNGNDALRALFDLGHVVVVDADFIPVPQAAAAVEAAAEEEEEEFRKGNKKKGK